MSGAAAQREGDAIRVTDAGQREHEIAKGERFTG